jgi:hypothetical protein
MSMTGVSHELFRHGLHSRPCRDAATGTAGHIGNPFRAPFPWELRRHDSKLRRRTVSHHVYFAGSALAGNFFSFFRIMSMAYSYPLTPQPICTVSSALRCTRKPHDDAGRLVLEVRVMAPLLSGVDVGDVELAGQSLRVDMPSAHSPR